MTKFQESPPTMSSTPTSFKTENLHIPGTLSFVDMMDNHKREKEFQDRANKILHAANDPEVLKSGYLALLYEFKAEQDARISLAADDDFCRQQHLLKMRKKNTEISEKNRKITELRTETRELTDEIYEMRAACEEVEDLKRDNRELTEDKLILQEAVKKSQVEIEALLEMVKELREKKAKMHEQWQCLQRRCKDCRVLL
jgi:chromosome segregation ATPase